MKKENKGEELQSRREFFKKAAKGALPIVAALALAGTPNLLKAAESTPMGCNSGCTSTCSGSCKGTCSACAAGCSNSCSNGCTGCSHGSKY